MLLLSETLENSLSFRHLAFFLILEKSSSLLNLNFMGGQPSPPPRDLPLLMQTRSHAFNKLVTMSMIQKMLLI